MEPDEWKWHKIGKGHMSAWQVRELLGEPKEIVKDETSEEQAWFYDDGGMIVFRFPGGEPTFSDQAERERWWRTYPQMIQIEMPKTLRKSSRGTELNADKKALSVEDLKKLTPADFQDWIIKQMKGTPRESKTGDMGIDGFTHLTKCPIQVKQSEKVGREVVTVLKLL